MLKDTADLLERDAEQLGEYAPRPIEAPAEFFVGKSGVNTIAIARSHISSAIYDAGQGKTLIFTAGDSEPYRLDGRKAFAEITGVSV